MKRKYTHHHGKIFWQIILTDAYHIITNDADKVELIVKTNSPTRKDTIYPKVTLKEAQIFVAWIESLPIYQLPAVIDCLFASFRPTRPWEDVFKEAQFLHKAK